MTKKESPENDFQEPLRESMRSFDLGDGIEASQGLSRMDGSVDIDYYFTNKLDTLKRSTLTELPDLKVEFSSVQSDDESLLAFLAQKTRP